MDECSMRCTACVMSSLHSSLTPTESTNSACELYFYNINDNPGQLSLLCSVEWEVGTSQSVMKLCDWGVDTCVGGR